MILGFQIGLIALAIYALATGKLPVTKSLAVHGLGARLIGLIGFIPLPLSFAVGLFIGMKLIAAGGDQRELETMKWTLMGIEAAITLGSGLLLYVLGWIFAEPVAQKRRPPHYEDRDDFRQLNDRVGLDYSPRSVARDNGPEERITNSPVPLSAPPTKNSFACNGCHKTIGVPLEAAGKKARCPLCGMVQEVPPLASAAVPPAIIHPITMGDPAQASRVRNAVDSNQDLPRRREEINRRDDLRHRSVPAQASNLGLIFVLIGVGAVFILAIGGGMLVLLLNQDGGHLNAGINPPPNNKAAKDKDTQQEKDLQNKDKSIDKHLWDLKKDKDKSIEKTSGI